MGKPKPKKLTAKQLKFAQVYDGNGTEAARLAGYKGSENTLAQNAIDLLRNPHITQIIAKRNDKIAKPLIMNRQQRQQLWSRIANTKSYKTSDRLRATELLGKSEADFIAKHEVDISSGKIDIILSMPINGSEANKK